MATVRVTDSKDPKKRFLVGVYKDRKQHWGSGPTEAKATRAAWEKAAGATRATPTGDKRRLGPFMEQWLAEIAKTKTPASAMNYRWHYERHIKGPLGGYLLTDLDAWTLERWATALPTNDKQHRCLGIVRACLSTAVKAKLLTVNPCAQVGLPPRRRKEGRAWTLEEARTFLDAVETHPYGAYFQVALRLGLRPSELLGLRWKAIDLERGTLAVVETRPTHMNVTYEGGGKTPSALRTFELDAEALDVLRRWKTAQRAQFLRLRRTWGADTRVCTGATGLPVTYASFSHAFRRLLAKAGVSTISLYQCRHTVITALIDAGVDLKVVSKLVGHASPQLTQHIYQQTRKGQGAAALATLGGLLRRGGAEDISATS